MPVPYIYRLPPISMPKVWFLHAFREINRLCLLPLRVHGVINYLPIRPYHPHHTLPFPWGLLLDVLYIVDHMPSLFLRQPLFVLRVSKTRHGSTRYSNTYPPEYIFTVTSIPVGPGLCQIPRPYPLTPVRL